MEPFGAGAPEIRLYRRPSFGAPLVEWAALGPVAPPRVIEVVSDPTGGEEVDGEPSRRPGLYLALVQDGAVVDVARLASYPGQTPGPEDLAEDYWGNGSDSSEDWRTRPRSSSSGTSKSSSASRSRGGKSSISSEEHNGKSTRGNSSSQTSSRDEQIGNSSSASKSSADQDAESSGGTSGTSQDQTRSNKMKGDQQERTDDEQNADDEKEDADDEKEDADDEKDAVYGDEGWNVNAMADEEDAEDCAKILEVEGKEEEKDVSSEEEEDVSSEEEKDVSSEEEQCHSVKLKLRIWPWQKHTSIKIFSGQKWIASKVYRLTWINHEELEELFESSFKLDVCAPISANTVFRIRHCLMDFETLMPDCPYYDELIDEFKSSVKDFRFCKKIGGEGVCRVFKCLSQGSIFALKTVRLKKSCSTEPREVEIIASLKDKRVMAFYQAWIEPWGYKKRPVSNHLFILIELCKSTLKDKLSIDNPESIVDRWYILEEIVKGVKAIHDELIVHRDLKPDNVFYGSDMGVRIGDFGDACMGCDEFGGYGGTPNLGTPFYAAAELKSTKKISQEADIYSMGVMALDLFTKFQTGSERFRLLTELRDK